MNLSANNRTTAYQARTTIDDSGRLVLSDLPFEKGDYVEVIVLADPRSELLKRVDAMFKRAQAHPEVQSLTDADIQAEIDAYRNGQ